MDFSTEFIRGHYLVSSSSNGAMSLLNPAEYLAFNYIVNAPEKEHRNILRNLMTEFGVSEENITSFSELFIRKMTMQGWFRDSFNDMETEQAMVIYFTIGTGCNLSCIYCYIGDDRRQPDNIMAPDDAATILNKIREFNPSSQVVVTGGEPLTHPRIFDILDTIEEYGLKFTLGTNAVLVDDRCAKRIKSYKNLTYVQTSLDGMSPETHTITRGNTWHQTMRGINYLIKYKVPFAIAPTIHEGNLHEINDIVRFAYGNGGFFAPNHLRKFPHAPNALDITLKSESLRKSILETTAIIEKEFNTPVQPSNLKDKKVEDLRDYRCRYVCGNASYTIDIDWNGEVYPCHLLRENEFILGNILSEEFPVIFERGRKSKTRLRSTEIPKCRKCPFVSTCAGGCRASSYYWKGTFAAEDEFCEILYKFEIDKLFFSKGITI